MSADWQYDEEWASEYDSDIRTILERNAIRFVRFETASFEQDTRQATDIVAVTDFGTFAKRVRRENCGFRDITIRYRRRVNGKPRRGYEADKLLDGYARGYIYAWVRR